MWVPSEIGVIGNQERCTQAAHKRCSRGRMPPAQADRRARQTSENNRPPVGKKMAAGIYRFLFDQVGHPLGNIFQSSEQPKLTFIPFLVAKTTLFLADIPPPRMPMRSASTQPLCSPKSLYCCGFVLLIFIFLAFKET